MSGRAVAEWRNRVEAEYRSAAITARALHWMIQCGFPDEMLRTTIRVVGDELDHAHLSHDVVVAIGGGDEPLALEARTLDVPVAETPLASLTDVIVRSFCLGETFAVPLFAAMREGTTHPVARAALDRVLRDEAVHRQLGWDALDALLAIDAAGVRERTEARLPGWMAGFEAGYGTMRPSGPLTDEEIAVGLLPIERWVGIWRRTVVEDVGPRFGRRGIRIGGADRRGGNKDTGGTG